MLDRTNARAFNNSLKKAVLELTGQTVKVEVINSYKFPLCWVHIYRPTPAGTFTNEFRLAVFDACGNDRAGLLNPDNVSYGNIRSNMIAAHVPQWEKLFNTDEQTLKTL
jgi:hypothetical protein